MSDPIADMLTRIRNGLQVRKTSVSIPSSKVKTAIANVLKQEGYIKNFSISGKAAIKNIEVELKYFRGKPVIEEIARISRPGCRIYVKCDNLPSVRNGLGVALVSTSKGILTDRIARQQGFGGEVICTVF